MYVSEDDSTHLKKWVVKRIEDISDADSDVLADYVIALIKSDDSDDDIRENCRTSLDDFLGEHAQSFVNDLFATVKSGSYLPGYKAPAVQIPTAPTAPPQPATFNPPTGPAFNPPTGPSAPTNTQPVIPGIGNGAPNIPTGPSRKRAFIDSDIQDGRDPHYSTTAGGDRNIKQMRRGNNRGPGAMGMSGRQNGPPSSNVMGLPGLSSLTMPPLNTSLPTMPQMPQVPQMPTPPPGFNPFNPNDPQAMLAMMQAMGGLPQLAGLPGFPSAGSPPPFGQQGTPPMAQKSGGSKPKRKCRDYVDRGFCMRGATCPFDHTNGEGYEPQNPSMAMEDQKSTNGHGSYDTSNRGGERGRGRGRGRGDRGGQAGGRSNRAAFSSAGPNQDRSITSVVVEQIPEDHFSEEAVRGFFSEFGNIEKVEMQAYKRLAIVKFEDYWQARAAYESPKVIFDNRFVKVYWYKLETLPTPPATAGATGSATANPASPANELQDTEMIDPEEVKRRQEEAQKAHEAKIQKIKESEALKAEIEEKLKEQAEERKKLLEKLAAKTGGKAGSPVTATATATLEKGDTPANASADVSAAPQQKSNAEALKVKLAELEAEAQSLGVPVEEPYPSTRGRGTRGGYRGRGGYTPRGRGYDPSSFGGYRGSYRGRGSFSSSPYGMGRGAVKRLDNRPKKVAVLGIAPGSDRDEALRQYLFQFEYESIDPHPDREDSQVILFKERYVAENFMAGAPSESTLSPLTKSDLAWIQQPLPPVNLSPATTTPTNGPSMEGIESKPADGDTTMGDEANGQEAQESAEGIEEHGYDNADDDDRWMATL